MTAVAYLCLVRATPLMIVLWLSFIVVGLVTCAGFLKIAARILRYSISWKASFLFASIMLISVIIDHVLVFSEPVVTRIGHGVVLVVGLVLLGGWFFSGRGTKRQGTALGWPGGLRLMALMFAMMIAVVFAIAVPVEVFLSKHLPASP